MKGDFSRQTFDPKKHYRGVLIQQGRVQVDADANEEQAIGRYLQDKTETDVIGSCGVPKPQYGGGFQIGISTGQNDLTISQGHIYVDGILCESDADTTLLTQPYFFSGTTPKDPGTYMVYLDVWERLITAVEDPAIRETALGGPDTATRVQLVWQVKLAQVGGLTEPVTCSTAQWKPADSTGTMQAQINPTAVAKPCVLPPQTGYRRLENQLYRVEIHTPGDRNTATFKWSRENGSVLATVNGVSGQTLTMQSVGRDENLGFAQDEWVELLDDRIDLTFQVNALLQIDHVDKPKREITLRQAPPSVDTKLHAKLRRWEQSGGNEVANGIPLGSGWFELEDGVQVQFGDGTYRTGDYWLIPARTAITAETGNIEWPVDGSGNPLSQLPQGIRHHYCALAIVGFDGKSYQYINDAIPDCRKPFPPLTDITASDVSYDPQNCSSLAGATTVQEALDMLCGGGSGACTIVPKPGFGWEAPLLALPEGADADICFPVGDFPLKTPAVLRGLRSLRLSGGGPGTRISADGSESALIFQLCRSVEISDLSAMAGQVQSPRLGGVLHFVDCSEVTVDSVHLHCAPGVERAAACISVENSITEPNQAEGAGSVRIRHCNLTVGANQDGILLVHVQRAQVEDNVMVVDNKLRLGFKRMLQNRRFRADAVRELISQAQFTKTTSPAKAKKRTAGKAADTTPAGAALKAPQNASVTVGNRIMTFRTNPLLKDFWQERVTGVRPKQFTTDRDLLLFMKNMATDFLLQPKSREGNSALNAALAGLEQLGQNSMARGIAVAGEGIQECRILNNSIQGAVQGITVGMSNHKRRPHQVDSASVVTIAGNQIYVALAVGAEHHARHAIFVGNVDSLMIESNYAELISNPRQIHVEAIRIWGHFGRRLIVRHCHVLNFSTGILVRPYGTPGRTPLWVVAENTAVNAGVVVSAPALVIQANNLA